MVTILVLLFTASLSLAASTERFEKDDIAKLKHILQRLQDGGDDHHRHSEKNDDHQLVNIQTVNMYYKRNNENADGSKEIILQDKDGNLRCSCNSKNLRCGCSRAGDRSEEIDHVEFVADKKRREKFDRNTKNDDGHKEIILQDKDGNLRCSCNSKNLRCGCSRAGDRSEEIDHVEFVADKKRREKFDRNTKNDDGHKEIILQDKDGNLRCSCNSNNLRCGCSRAGHRSEELDDVDFVVDKKHRYGSDESNREEQEREIEDMLEHLENYILKPEKHLKSGFLLRCHDDKCELVHSDYEPDAGHQYNNGNLLELLERNNKHAYGDDDSSESDEINSNYENYSQYKSKQKPKDKYKPVAGLQLTDDYFNYDYNSERQNDNKYKEKRYGKKQRDEALLDKYETANNVLEKLIYDNNVNNMKKRKTKRHKNFILADSDNLGNDYKTGDKYESSNKFHKVSVEDSIQDTLLQHGKRYRLNDELDALVISFKDLNDSVNSINKRGNNRDSDEPKIVYLDDLDVKKLIGNKNGGKVSSVADDDRESRPKWQIPLDTVGRSMKRAKKNLLPLTSKQKIILQRKLQKRNKSLRRNQNNTTYGVPFQLNVEGLGQVNP